MLNLYSVYLVNQLDSVLFFFFPFSELLTLLQDKFKLRLKTLEEGLKHVSSFSVNSPKPAKTSNILGFLTSSGGLRKRSSSQPRGSTINSNTPLRQPNIENENANAARELKQADSFKKKYCSAENKMRNSLWASRSKIIDSSVKENKELKENTDANINKYKNDETAISVELKNKAGGIEDLRGKGTTQPECEDVVSGFLYDRLQKEVINLRKSCEAKGSSLDAKDREIQVK